MLAEHLDYVNTIDRTGPTFMLPNGVQTTTGAEITSCRTRGRVDLSRGPREHENVRDTSHNYTSFFVQDSWRIESRVTITRVFGTSIRR